jgi:hypothetical protein
MSTTRKQARILILLHYTPMTNLRWRPQPVTTKTKRKKKEKRKKERKQKTPSIKESIAGGKDIEKKHAAYFIIQEKKPNSRSNAELPCHVWNLKV